jgi:hypothetical protein
MLQAGMYTSDHVVGSYYLQIPRATHFTVELIDLDSQASPDGSVHPAVLGPAVRNAVLQAETSDPHLGFREIDYETIRTLRIQNGGIGVDPFEYGRSRVENQDVWAVMIINANATSGVWSALNSGTSWQRESPGDLVYPFCGVALTVNTSWRCHYLHLRRSQELLRG